MEGFRSSAGMILRFSYARFHFVYIKQLTGLFGEISENSSRLQTNAWNFKCNFAGGGTVYKLNFVSGALESSTRQRLPIIQNLMQTVSTLSKSIYIYIRGRKVDLACKVTHSSVHRSTFFNSAFSPFLSSSFSSVSFPSLDASNPCLESFRSILLSLPYFIPPRRNRNLRIRGKSGMYGCSVAYSR